MLFEDLEKEERNLAAIDKIYGTYQQHLEFKTWCEENNYGLRYFFYLWEDEWITDGKDHPIANFSGRADKWLLDHCPIDWVVARIKDQYGIE